MTCFCQWMIEDNIRYRDMLLRDMTRYLMLSLILFPHIHRQFFRIGVDTETGEVATDAGDIACQQGKHVGILTWIDCLREINQ